MSILKATFFLYAPERSKSALKLKSLTNPSCVGETVAYLSSGYRGKLYHSTTRVIKELSFEL